MRHCLLDDAWNCGSCNDHCALESLMNKLYETWMFSVGYSVASVFKEWLAYRCCKWRRSHNNSLSPCVLECCRNATAPSLSDSTPLTWIWAAGCITTPSSSRGTSSLSGRTMRARTAWRSEFQCVAPSWAASAVPWVPGCLKQRSPRPDISPHVPAEQILITFCM